MSKRKNRWLQELFVPVGSSRDEAGILYRADTDYGYIEIEEQLFRGHHARLLFVDGALESAMALERGARQTLLFSYLRGFDDASKLRPERCRSGNALLIGGGGFVYADHFLKSYPGSRMDVAEISGEIVDLARRYFSLSALESEEETASRFRLNVTDGVSLLLGTQETYDFIFNDAFCGRESDSGLLGIDGIILARAHLKEGGLYVMNFVTALKGPLSLTGKRLRRRFLSQFRHVLLMQADESRSLYERQNCILIASDQEL